jgi:hypothetical protein
VMPSAAVATPATIVRTFTWNLQHLVVWRRRYGRDRSMAAARQASDSVSRAQ